jgi:sirohydrochlorin cobaltochelatase
MDDGMYVSTNEESLLLVGHGTHDARGVRQFRQTARLVADRWHAGPVQACFLELASPSIGEAVDALVEQQVRRIVVAPLLLFAAGHAKEDIPGQVQAACRRHRRLNLDLRYAPPLGSHRRVLELSAARYVEAISYSDHSCKRPLPLGEGVAGLAIVQPNRGASEFLRIQRQAQSEFSRIQRHAQTGMSVPPFGLGEGPAICGDSEDSHAQDTLLVFVGRGSSDPEAIAQMHRFARLRRELTPVGEVLTCFCAAASPSLDEGLQSARASSAERIVVQPHLLFEGAVMDSIRQQVAAVAEADLRRRWSVAGCLGPSTALAEAIVETAGSKLAEEV